jgi:O-antigen ligase
MLAHGFMGLYLFALLAVPRVSTSLAALTCLTALAAGLHHWRDDARAGFRHMAPLVVPATLYLLHILVQILAGMAPPGKSSDLLIGLLTLAVGLSGVPERMADVRRWILPAAALGAVASCLLALYQVWVLGYLRPYGWLGSGTLGNGAIKFGDLASLQALLAFVLVLTAVHKWHRLLGLAGLFCGMLTLALTQTRGGILGVVLAVTALALAIGLRRRHERQAGFAAPASAGRAARFRPGITAAMLAVALVLSLSAAGFMQKRFAEIEPQVHRYLQGDIDSEVGQRLALWQAAVRAGATFPLTGVGFGRFGEELKRQSASGEIPSKERILYGLAHSEYLSAFAEAGLSGFIALALMFVAPMVALLRQIAAGGGSPASYAALVTAAAFAGFALTDDMFDRQITTIAFFLLNAWFLRAAWKPPAWKAAAASALPGQVTQ